MSVTELNVPLVVVKATVPPLLVGLLLYKSFSCTVIVVVLVPLATILVRLTLIVDLVTLAAPGTKITLFVALKAKPPTVPLTVPVPATVEVIVAVYDPLLLFVTELTVPKVLLKVTVPPLLVKLLP